MYKFKKISLFLIALMAVSVVYPFFNFKNSNSLTTAANEIRASKDAEVKNPALGQNFLVYIAYKNSAYNLFVYDLITKQETKIDSSVLSVDALGPVVFGDNVYWVDHTVNGWVFNEYNVARSVLKNIKTESRQVLSFSVYEGALVYEAKENGVMDVFVMDKQTGVSRNITNDETYQKAPSIFGNIVAWSEFPIVCETVTSTVAVPKCDVSLYGRVATYDLNSNVKTILFDNVANLSNVKSNNQTLAWSQLEGSTNVVKVYYTNVGKLVTVSPGDYHSYNPEMSGDLLVYFVKRAQGDDLEMYQFSTGKHTILSWTKATKKTPALGSSNYFVTWVDNRLGSNDVYYFDSREESNKIDQDGDGLTDAEEVKLGTNIYSADTDNDGLKDYDEVNRYHTYPTQYDSDGDGLKDGEEVNNWLSNPLKFDSNDDGIDDKTSVSQGFNPMADRTKLTVYRTIKLENPVQENQEATYLKRALNNYLGRGRWSAKNQAEWKKITTAYSYGGYNIKEIASYLRGNKSALSFDTLASVWREEQELAKLANR